MSVLFYTLLIILSVAQDPKQGSTKEHLRIHHEAIVIDTHNDLLMRVIDGDRVEAKSSKGHSDLVRFNEGGYDGQVFSVWVDPVWASRDSAYIRANAMIDSLDAIIKRNPEKIVKVRNGNEFDVALKNGKLAAMIGLEGGHSIENSTANLLHFYQRGVRYLGVTWNNSTAWATSARDEATKDLKRKGLSEHGMRIVRLMDSLGMLIDVSHCGEQTFWDILSTTKQPIIASHSSVYKICPHFRNLKDEQIRAVAKSGGVMMINFYPSFIDSNFERNRKRLGDKGKANTAANYPSSTKKHISTQVTLAKILPSVRTVADHIDYVRTLVGIDYVGMGADYDGIDTAPKELEDVSKISNLTKELLRRGYSESDVKKVLGGNFLRVFKQVCRM